MVVMEAGMRFERGSNGSIILHTKKYGVFEFSNTIKFYKFQLLCKHPSTYIFVDDDTNQVICERCCKMIREWKDAGPCKTLDQWGNEGGPTYD